ncbi:MAG TPA: GntR family transcriptional regulator [Oceanospirillaceae bacterium]|nr:GntR family transcriptional regulator [Oceanospirillaceae bacterium]
MTPADQLREQLEQEIVSGRLKPGDRLNEEALAERFLVSRTPVREALQRLAISGLVEQRHRRGTFVRKISFTEMIEMFEVMAELEGMCGRLAARRIVPADAAQIEQALADCSSAAESGDNDAYYHANAEFHNHIYQASKNGVLIEQAQLMHNRLAPYRRLQIRVPHRMHQSLKQHISIAQSILAGDEKQAEIQMKDHVLIQGEKFFDLASSYQQAI